MEERNNVGPSFSFYGIKAKKRNLHLSRSLEEQSKRFKQEKFPVQYHSRILGPSTRWQIFFRQQDAFDFVCSQSEDLHVFAFESQQPGKEAGQRQYLAASYPVFWHYCMQLEQSQRHHYEVIPEGSPCKLYFDLEFYRESNPGCRGPDVVKTLIKLICKFLQAVYHVECNRQMVLDLDASTSTKFSRHLIFQTKNAVFRDNISAGLFVRAVFSRLEAYLLGIITEKASPEGHNMASDTKTVHPFGLMKSLSAVPQSPKPAADEADPAERDEMLSPDLLSVPKPESLPSSGKCTSANVTESAFGESAESITCPGESTDSFKPSSDCLKTSCISDSDSCKACGKGDICDQHLGKKNQPVLDSSICKAVFQQFTPQELQTLFVKDKDGRTTCFADLGVYTKNRNFRLYKSCKLGKNNPFQLAAENTFVPDVQEGEDIDQAIFLSSLIANVSVSDKTGILTYSGSNVRNQGRRASLTDTPRSPSCEDHHLEGFSRSPYPEVDQFILGLVAGEERRGSIRRWTYFPQAEILSYNIVGYRFCFNIQRQHRSNNIKIIVDLKRGVWYQKCHDPDCQAINFKSEEHPLPDNILPAHYFLDDDFGEEEGASFDSNNGVTCDELSMEETEDDAACLAALEETESKIAGTASVETDS